MADNSPVVRVPRSVDSLLQLAALGVPPQQIPPRHLATLGDVANINHLVTTNSDIAQIWVATDKGGGYLAIDVSAVVKGFFFKREVYARMYIRKG